MHQTHSNSVTPQRISSFGPFLVSMMFLSGACTQTNQRLPDDQGQGPTLAQAPASPKKSGPSVDLSCPAPQRMCPMIYKPSVCTLLSNGKTLLEKKGTNDCTARQELHRSWCESPSAAAPQNPAAQKKTGRKQHAKLSISCKEQVASN